MEQIVVFDMDGVLAEVTESYRQAIIETVAHFTDQRVDQDLIQSYKNQSGWNNDWALSQKICLDLGVSLPYDTVVDYFNEIFIGPNHGDGLISREGWFPEPGMLERLQQRFGIALFTGRLQYEAEITLKRFAPAIKFDPMLCADHVVNSKPAPDGLLQVKQMKPGAKLWYVGDTVDDARCARAANVPFIGVASKHHLTRSDILRLFNEEKAIAVVENVNEIEGALV